MDSQPFARADLDAMIAAALATTDDDVRAVWAEIRIEPALWRCSDPSAPHDKF